MVVKKETLDVLDVTDRARVNENSVLSLAWGESAGSSSYRDALSSPASADHLRPRRKSCVVLAIRCLLPGSFSNSASQLPVQGSHGTTSSGRQYASYQGIRYAEPPTGNRRCWPTKNYFDISSGLWLLCPIIQKRGSGTYLLSPQLFVRESLIGSTQLGKWWATKIACSWTSTPQKIMSRLPSLSWSGFTGAPWSQGRAPTRSTDHSICLTSGPWHFVLWAPM